MTTTARCVIRDADQRILLIHRRAPERWELPGGKLEAGEQPAQAAVRELNEELSVQVEIQDRLGVFSEVRDGNLLTYVWFSAVIASGEPTIREPQTHDRFEYVPVGDIQGRVLSPNLAAFLRSEYAG